MTNIIIGISIGIILCPLLIYIIGKFCDDPQITYKDGAYDVRPKNYKTPEIYNQSNFTVYIHDDEYTSMHLDEDEKKEEKEEIKQNEKENEKEIKIYRIFIKTNIYKKGE